MKDVQNLFQKSALVNHYAPMHLKFCETLYSFPLSNAFPSKIHQSVDCGIAC